MCGGMSLFFFFFFISNDQYVWILSLPRNYGRTKQSYLCFNFWGEKTDIDHSVLGRQADPRPSACCPPAFWPPFASSLWRFCFTCAWHSCLPVAVPLLLWWSCCHLGSCSYRGPAGPGSFIAESSWWERGAADVSGHGTGPSRTWINATFWCGTVIGWTRSWSRWQAASCRKVPTSSQKGAWHRLCFETVYSIRQFRLCNDRSMIGVLHTWVRWQHPVPSWQ